MNIVDISITKEEFKAAGEKMGGYCQPFVLNLTLTTEDDVCHEIAVTHKTPALGDLIGALCSEYANGLETQQGFQEYLDENAVVYSPEDMNDWDEPSEEASEDVKAAWDKYCDDKLEIFTDLYSDVAFEWLEQADLLDWDKFSIAWYEAAVQEIADHELSVETKAANKAKFWAAHPELVDVPVGDLIWEHFDNDGCNQAVQYRMEEAGVI